MRHVQTITKRAREFRKNQTPAETKLWENLRNRKLGVKFVRQKPFVLDYCEKKVAFVADFYCSAAHLIIEVDGSVHSKQSDYDLLRTTLLNQKGINLVRFTNDNISQDIVTVLQTIKNKISKFEVLKPPLSTKVERGWG